MLFTILTLFVASCAASWTVSCPNGNVVIDTNQCKTLWAGQTINAGTVCASILSGGYLRVVYTTIYGWKLNQIHLWAGEAKDDYPQTNTGNPKIGNFPFKDESLDTTTYTVDISLSTLLSNTCQCEDSPFYLMAHAVVSKSGAGTETAWADGIPVTNRGSWATEMSITISYTCGPSTTSAAEITTAESTTATTEATTATTRATTATTRATTATTQDTTATTRATTATTQATTATTQDTTATTRATTATTATTGAPAVSTTGGSTTAPPPTGCPGTCETAYAYGLLPFCGLSLTCDNQLILTKWGWTQLYVLSSVVQTAQIYAGARSCVTLNGKNVGKVDISWNGRKIRFSISLYAGFKFEHSAVHIHVGNQRLPTNNGCETVVAAQFANNITLNALNTNSCTGEIAWTSLTAYISIHMVTCPTL